MIWLAYMATVTDRGPLRWWLRIIGGGRTTAAIDCGIAQNAAHLLRCPLVGDGKGRTA